VTQVTTKAPANPCLLQHYSQYPSYGKSQYAPLMMNGLYTMEFYSSTKNKILSFAGNCIELENVILSEISLRRAKATYSPSYADYRTKMNAAI
jgi:hypothetical protein